MRLSRRSVVQMSLCSVAQAAVGRGEAAPRIVFPTDPRRRIAVATYPFRAMIVAPGNADRVTTRPGLDLAAFARFIRSEFDVYGIEPLHSHFASTARADVVTLKAAFDEAGVRVVNIPVDEEVDLSNAQATVREAGYAAYRKWVDIAVLLESPSIRIGVPRAGGAQDAAGAAEALRRVIVYAAARNVIVNLENDDPLLANEARIVAILRLVASPFLRALPDFANSLMGGDERFNAAAVRTMFAYATNVAHVKDAEVIQGVRRTVSLEEMFAIAKDAQYRGYFSMESDSDVDAVRDTKHLIERCVALC